MTLSQKDRITTLLLVDAHAMIHRAFHALPPSFTSKDGTPTNAVYGFWMMLQKIITDLRPSHIAVCFDTPVPTFRKKLYVQYQATRPKMDTTLSVQIPIIRSMLSHAGLCVIDKPGYEADDVIGSLATSFGSVSDRILILTGDRDILQLASSNISVIAPKKGVSEFALFTPDQVVDRYHVTATQIPDYKALAGDSSDNYHSAPGIGPKTASQLISQFGTIEGLFSNLDKVENVRIRTILTSHKDEIILLKHIATIVRDLELNVNTDKMKFDSFSDALQDDLKQYQLISLLSKIFPKKTSQSKIVKEKTEYKEKDTDTTQIGLFDGQQDKV